MRVAIIARIENYKEDYPFNIRYKIDESFKKIFDELNILIIPIISEKNLNEISELCDFLYSRKVL